MADKGMKPGLTSVLGFLCFQERAILAEEFLGWITSEPQIILEPHE